MADIATQGLLPNSGALRTRRVETQVESIFRNRAGSSVTTIGSSGSVADATTVVKGKLKLANHLAGTADAPTLNPAASPQIAGLRIKSVAAETTVNVDAVSGQGNILNFSEDVAGVSTPKFRIRRVSATALNFIDVPGGTSGAARTMLSLQANGQVHMQANSDVAPIGGTQFNLRFHSSGTVDGRSDQGDPATDALVRGYTRLSFEKFGGGEFVNFTNGIRGNDVTIQTALTTNHSAYHDIGCTHTMDAFGAIMPFSVSVTVEKPDDAVFPNTYNETNCIAARIEAVNNKGTYAGNWESFVKINNSSDNAAAGPARVFGAIIQVQERNPYASYTSTEFGAGSTWLNSAARGIWMEASGAYYLGTGILLRGSGGGSADGSSASAYKRALVLCDRAAADIFCLDGSARMGFGKSTNQTGPLTHRITLGFTNAGVLSTVAADGMLFGDTNLYTNGNLQLKTDNIFICGGTFRHLGVGIKFFNAASDATKQTVSGSRGGNAGLGSLLTALSTYGLVTDSTTDLGGLLKTSYDTAGLASDSAANGIDFGGDVALHRNGANVLYTPDKFGVNRILEGAPASAEAGVVLATAGRVDVSRAAASGVAYSVFCSATPDTATRWQVSLVTGGARMQFSPGDGSWTANPFIEATADRVMTVSGAFLMDRVDGFGYTKYREQTTAVATPAANHVALYAKDDGAGNTRLYAKDSTGTERVIDWT